MYVHLPIHKMNAEPSNLQSVGTVPTNSFRLHQSLFATNRIQFHRNFPDKSVTWKLSALLQLQLQIKQRLSPKQPGLLDSCPTEVPCLYKPFSCSTLIKFCLFCQHGYRLTPVQLAPSPDSTAMHTSRHRKEVAFVLLWLVHTTVR